jgi:crotonobetainyl-CoA:carnitine CoA-transferase CaiB-like acyl-CoA transferase
LCEQVLARPDLAADPRFTGNENRLRNRRDLEPQIEAGLARYSVEEAEAALEAAAVPYARMNDVEEVLRHPQVLERGRLLSTRLPGGAAADLLRAPFNIEGVEESPDEVPSVGQHTDEVLTELGFDAGAIAGLRASGAV